MSGSDPNDAIREAARDVLRELVPGMLRDVIADSLTEGAGNGHGHEQHARNGHSNGNGGSHASGGARASADDALPVPRVPAPPVAAVLRPSTWDRPAAPGEVIGGRADTPQPDERQPDERQPDERQPDERQPGERQPGERQPGERQLRELQASSAPSPAAAGQSRIEPVTIDTDEDLERFIRELMSRLENPRERLAIRRGQLRFALRRSAVANGEAGQTDAGAVTRVQRGAVTERLVGEAAEAGTSLVLAPGAVLTPLARDRAKALGVQIERERRC